MSEPTIEEVVEAAAKIFNLGRDPEPGLLTWNVAFRHAIMDFRELTQDMETKKKG